MKRYEIINELIKQRGYKDYLEVGIEDPRNCFDRILCENKEGVEPNLRIKSRHDNIVITTSDFYFEHTQKTFDIVFIDGLHEWGQVLKDIHNAYERLKQGGVILIHDVDCETEWLGRPHSAYRVHEAWKGTTWKGWWEAVSTLGLTNLYYTIMTDEGIGVMDTRYPLVLNPTHPFNQEAGWAEYNESKEAILKPVTVDQFLDFVRNETPLFDTPLPTTATDGEPDLSVGKTGKGRRKDSVNQR